MAKATAAAKPAAPTHSKEQLLRSQRYAKRRDLLGALLEGGKWYTLEEVDTAMSITVSTSLSGRRMSSLTWTLIRRRSLSLLSI